MNNLAAEGFLIAHLNDSYRQFSPSADQRGDSLVRRVDSWINAADEILIFKLVLQTSHRSFPGFMSRLDLLNHLLQLLQTPLNHFQTVFCVGLSLLSLR